MKKIQKYLPQILAIVVLISAWQLAYMLKLFPALVFPSIGDIFGAMFTGFTGKQLGTSVLYSLYFIFRGLLLGVGLAFLFSALSMINKPIRKIYYMVISLFDPLPGIALLPLAILWFGIGDNAIVFVMVHGVLWPLSRSILDGFSTVPAIYVETGKNYGLRGLRLVLDVYLPAAMPHIISGIKTGWARAWRALISAEMIFGASGAVGGIGWYIYTSRYKLDTPSVFASLIVIIALGILMEYGVFEIVERRTIRRWGVVR